MTSKHGSVIRDDTITCAVVDEDNAVEYEGEVTTLSNLGTRLLRDLYGWKATYSVQGPLYFTYKGEALSDIRDRLESSE